MIATVFPVTLRRGRRLACATLLGVALAGVGGASARDGKNAAILGGVAAGVLGGVAAGAILNGANPPAPVYRERRVLVDEDDVVERPRRAPICHYERRKVWLDDEDFTYKRVEVCE